MKRLFNIKKTLVVVLGAMSLLAGCTKYANPPATYEDYEQNLQLSVKRKVLFISIDGLVGQELKKSVPNNIAELLKTSKYTFESIAGDKTNDASTWMSMMSGVPYDLHHIEDDSYIPRPNENDPHANSVGYPSMLYRLATAAPTQKSYVVARDVTINTKLLTSAEQTYDANSDADVKKNVVDLLEKKNPDLAIVQFKDVLNAGLEKGFSISIPEYAAAIQKVDGYLGEILSALKTRKNYASEDWLIIVTSNHGGTGKVYGGNSLAERNTFSIFQNPKFKALELKSDIIKSMRFFGFYDAGQSTYANYNSNAFRARNNPVLSQESIYDVGKTGELTVDAKVKMNATNGVFDYSSNAPFLGKNQSRTGSTPGWAFFKSGNALTFFVADGSTNMQPGMGPVSSAGEWCHIAAVVSKVNNVPNVKVYVNGIKTGEASSASFNVNNAVSSTGLTFGYFPYIFSGLPVDMQICDVHIYNKAMSEEMIKKNAERIGIPDTEISNSNLIGYWPMDQLVDNKFVNKISGNPDIAAQGISRLMLMGNNLPYVDPGTILIQSEDMFTQIFYWLEVKTQREWGLTGQVFLNKYEVEFLLPKQ